MLSFWKSAKWLILSVLVMLSVGCSSPKLLGSAPEVVPPPAIPPLSPELKVEPKPSGSYWGSVMEWRKAWREKLKTLPE